MKDKLKKILIPFVLMLIFNLGIYLIKPQNFAVGLSPYLGVLLISGLLLGPYGAIGATVGNLLCDLIRGYTPTFAIISAFIGFGISFLSYKLWYRDYNNRKSEITRPKLNNTTNVLLFLSILIVCGILYVKLHGTLFYLTYANDNPVNYALEIRYFLNFINSSFIFGIIGIWISNRTDFVEIPKISKKEFNGKLYDILEFLLILTLIISIILDYSVNLNNTIIACELIAIIILLYAFLTKPITSKVMVNNSKSISEDIMSIFQITIIFIMIIGIVMSYDHTLITAVDDLLPLDRTEVLVSMMVLMDIVLLIFLIPSLAILRYVEKKIVKPLLSFSEIERFIHENEKIEAEGLVKVYSKYVNEENEIGTLARSYTDLITFNNNYIENMREIEGEKERIKAELDIATRIQASNLPTKGIETDEYIVNGYSQPAKEVGGDFFDYYMLDDDNLAIVIGDASGKGVPAAILAMVTQVMVRHLVKTEKDPSKTLYSVNNLLCENNSEAMFLTLWLGIYNKTTGKITFSNAGHTPPLIEENGRFEYLNIDSGIVLGIMDDFEYVTEEIDFSSELVLYTDGITDANNAKNEMYGEERLQKFFNEFKGDVGPIKPLLKDISNFTKDSEQFDDMTLLYLKKL